MFKFYVITTDSIAMSQMRQTGLDPARRETINKVIQTAEIFLVLVGLHHTEEVMSDSFLLPLFSQYAQERKSA
jgi:hypothetical protein